VVADSLAKLIARLEAEKSVSGSSGGALASVDLQENKVLSASWN